MDDYVDMPLRLDWPVVCRLACKAMIANRTFDEQVAVALKEGLEATKPKPKHRKTTKVNK